MVIKMKKRNICKFVDKESSSKISTFNFILETEQNEKTANAVPNNNAVYLVTSGSGVLHTAAAEAELCPGNVFFTFSGVPYKIENADGLIYMYITFNGGRSEELFSRFGVSPSSCVFKGHEGLIPFWENAIVKTNEKNLDLISESVLLYTFGEMTPPEKKDVGLVSDILALVKENFTDSDFNLASLADDLGYNSKYISRLFKEHMGVSFSSYLTTTRIQNAIFLIEQGVTSIKNVSLLSGYKDPLYFSSVFKNSVGMSPSEYVSSIEEKK